MIYNILFIHRAFCITYFNWTELFIWIHTIRFVRIDERNDTWIEFEVDKRYVNEKTLNNKYAIISQKALSLMEGLKYSKKRKEYI